MMPTRKAGPGSENANVKDAWIFGSARNPKTYILKDQVSNRNSISSLVKVVEDEAVEEDDSDNDLLRFQENEKDEDIDDYEELNDLIAIEYDERPTDNEWHNELH
ncbi:DNA helicase [Sarracenia purpurea var. burkii]